MNFKPLHPWDLSPKAAIALQLDLAPRLVSGSPLEIGRIKRVAGIDVSVKSGRAQAAVVVMSFPDLSLIETVLAQQVARYPYIPGLLAFREGPVVLQALGKSARHPMY